MAKKRKRQEERKEEREYKPPEFDRREYVKTEVGVSKATILSALFSIPMGLAAMFIMPVGGFGSGLMAGIAGIGVLWFLLPLIIDGTKAFKPMNWVGIFSTYFMVFLAVWVISCNPPFNDFATPEIRSVRVTWNDGANNIIITNVTASGTGGELQVKIPANIANATPVTNITILAQVTDNTDNGVSQVNISIGDGNYAMVKNGDTYSYEYYMPAETPFITITIRATDTDGNAHEGYSFKIIRG